MLLGSVAVCSALATPPPADANYFSTCGGPRNFDGRSMRVRDLTRYNDGLHHAVREWGELAGTSIKIVSGRGYPTLAIYDIYSDQSYFAIYNCGGDIRLNTRTLSTRPRPSGPRNTITHELGHPIGLGDHPSQYANILMYEAANGVQRPTRHDRSDYRGVWMSEANSHCRVVDDNCTVIGIGLDAYDQAVPPPFTPEPPDLSPADPALQAPELIDQAEYCAMNPIEPGPIFGICDFLAPTRG